MLKRGNSRGLSTIVATLLIILLTLVAVGIIWVVLRNAIVNQSESAKTQKEFFSENIQIANLRVNNDLVNISLERIGGELKIKDQGGQNKTTEEVIQADIISVVDLSGSMSPTCNRVVSSNCCRNTLGGSYDASTQICSNVNPVRNITCATTCAGVWEDKLSSSKDANKELIKIISQVEGSRIGLVGYNTSIINSASLSLTNNLDDLNNTIDSWKAGGNTCICCGINEAVRILQGQSSSEKSKKIIVMSDGEANRECAAQHTNNPIQDAIKASCDAKGNLSNLIIYSIGLGENVSEETLVNISVCGGGKYFSAINVSELIDVYKYVAEQINSVSTTVSKFNYLYIIFYNGTTSYKEKISEIPDPFAKRNYRFDLTGKLGGNITKIEIYPVIVTDTGKEVIGPLFDSWVKG